MDEQAKGRRPESANGVSRPRKKRRRRKRSVVGQILFTLWTLFLVFAISCSFLACFAAVYIKNVIMPNTELTLTDYSMSLSSTIYYTDPNTGAEIEYEALHGPIEVILYGRDAVYILPSVRSLMPLSFTEF